MTENPYGDTPVFRELRGDDIGDLETTEIESMCMNCHDNGLTKLLLTMIPFFREVIISSFDCPHCHFSDTEIQPGGAIQDKGCKITIDIKTEKDMNRQVVKSNSAWLRIPELDFEIPANSQKGTLTTVEGLTSRAVAGLEQDQTVRRIMNPDTAAQIDDFIEKLKNLKPPYQLILDDPSGNSFIENPNAPHKDPALHLKLYTRTAEQSQQLGINEANDEDSDGEEEAEGQAAEGQSSEVNVKESGDADDDWKDSVMSFNVDCTNCNAKAKTNMKIVNIPHFKEVILMALVCDACGYRTNEVKSGAGIEPKGKKLTLRITDSSDLSRDVLKSETCAFEIPDLDFELMMGTLGGKFTTLEGLLIDIKDQLTQTNMFSFGDSGTDNKEQKMKEFLSKMDQIIDGEKLVTVVLDDPAGNSYIQNVYAPDPDPELTVEEYERNEEQNDDLGITHMNTENYT